MNINYYDEIKIDEFGFNKNELYLFDCQMKYLSVCSDVILFHIDLFSGFSLSSLLFKDVFIDKYNKKIYFEIIINKNNMFICVGNFNLIYMEIAMLWVEKVKLMLNEKCSSILFELQGVALIQQKKFLSVRYKKKTNKYYVSVIDERLNINKNAATKEEASEKLFLYLFGLIETLIEKRDKKIINLTDKKKLDVLLEYFEEVK